MDGEEDLQRGLLQIKRKKVLFLLGFVGILPAGMLLGLLSSAASWMGLHSHVATAFVVIPIIIYMLVLLVLHLMEGSAICPSCHKPFHSRTLKGKSGWVFMNYFSWSCLNCGISLNADNNAQNVSKNGSNSSVEAKFRVLPVLAVSTAMICMGSVIRTPSSHWSSWMLHTGVIMIPMGFLLAFGVQAMRRRQIEYSLSRAAVLGVVVAVVSFGLVEVAASGIIIKLIYSLVEATS